MTFKIISIAVMLIILPVLLFRKKSVEETVDNDSDKQKNMDSVTEEIEYNKRCRSDFAKAEFFDDSKSSEPGKRREGSHFWIESCRMSDGIHLSLNKNNWGAATDYTMREDGFVESVKTVKGEDMLRLMKLCDNAENGSEVVEYLHKRFSADGYKAFLNMLQWMEDNNIGMTCWSNL